MIFGIWGVAWVAMAESFAMLVIPALAVVVRAYYLKRPIFHGVQVVATGVALVLFVFQLILGEELNAAGLMSLKVVASTLILNHLFWGMKRFNVRFLGARLGTFSVILQRSVDLVFSRLADIADAAKFRWRARESLGISPWEWAKGSIRTSFKEIWQTGSEVERLRQSRGRIPVTAGWGSPLEERSLVVVGDVAFFALAVVGEALGETSLVPAFFGQYF